MQPRTVQVGPLAAATVTKIGLSQTPAGAGGLVLNGADGTAVSNNICASQSGTTATPLVINGVLKQTRYVSPTSRLTGATIAWLPIPSPIYVTSAGDDHTTTFAVVGLQYQTNAVISETITGTNTSVVATVNAYSAILSVTPSANTASTVTVGAMGVATLDTPRRVLFTPGASGTARTVVLSGTNWAGFLQSETITLDSAGDAVYSVLDYATVTSAVISGGTGQTIEIGTNGVASSQWINLDSWAQGILGQAVVSGTVGYTVECTNDDPNSYSNPVLPVNVTWDTALLDLATQTASMSFHLGESPTWIRVLMNSNTNPGYIRMTVSQNSSVPY